MSRNIRVGLLLPSSNSIQEPDFYRTLPENVTLHATRLTLENIEPSSTLKIGEQVEDGARRLSHADVDIIVLAATAPSSRNGMGYDRELIERITRASGKPATTASTALIEALKTIGARKIGLAAPWSNGVNQTTANFIEQNGFNVVTQSAIGLVANLEVGRLAPETALETGKKVAVPEADAVMLCCGNWNTFPIVDTLEKAIAKPVLTTNQVSIWHVFKMVGLGPVQGLGTLLRDHL
ncbi:maleate cis-trans isomerase family protein [Ancylobacter polymorphus]|uniref:Aspartate/glutamate racemase family protein n=1 Tax=Ancylobacter polymorphus TaxID=223390 RepID=A0A9E6ZZQ4_9HYPH|nr:aspartate/glutamate racemase family protein [Ancylobacter polymorphus]UOK73321.1 aspartate/glutamate racemase family protein [Ancylobacter polymorphus]